MMALQEMAVLNGFNVIYGLVKFFITEHITCCDTRTFNHQKMFKAKASLSTIKKQL